MDTWDVGPEKPTDRPRRGWLAPRSIGQWMGLVLLIALGLGTALAVRRQLNPASAAPVRRFTLRRVPPPAPPPRRVEPDRLDDRIILPARPGIDERMVVVAREGIDERMIVPPGALRHRDSSGTTPRAGRMPPGFSFDGHDLPARDPRPWELPGPTSPPSPSDAPRR